MTKRVLITGASGLLGRAIFREFNRDPYWETLGLAFSRARGKLKKVDITKPNEVEKVMKSFKPTVVIHSAAERRPDAVEKQEEATRILNVDATRTICEQAAKVGAFVVFISTDYVFDGTNAPYKESDEPHPLNKYGESKLEGEKVTLETGELGNIVMRVPVLYGDIEYLAESAVTILFEKVKDTDNQCTMSAYERRYPTHVADIAWVLRELLERRVENPSLTGIFHWSGEENMTKYDMAITMAEVFGLPSQHIQPDKKPSGGAKRPYDAHLDSSRIEKMGICRRTAFNIGIYECLRLQIDQTSNDQDDHDD